MVTLERAGSYCGVETLKAYLPQSQFASATYDASILDHLEAASRDVERLLLRAFHPYTGTNKYRWPPEYVLASWRFYTDDDLLSLMSFLVADSGQNAAPVAITNYFLEPQAFGPPYNRVEVDLSSQDIFQSGPTPQQAVALTGQWGFTNATIAAGTLAASMLSTDTTLTCSSGALIDQGDVLLIDSEAIAVTAPRGYPASTTLAITRGVDGTTAASHSNGAAISKYQAPSNIRQYVRSKALSTFLDELSRFGRAPAALGAPLKDPWEKLEAQLKAQYTRLRVAAI